MASCGWLPPDHPAPAVAARDPDAPLYGSWTVTGHVLADRALLSDLEAAEFHARSVTISTTAYGSPWSGRCDDAARHKVPRRLAELAALRELTPAQAAGLGLAEPILEYQLACAPGRAPPLTIFLGGGGHAVTCWSGVCYVLARAGG